VTTTTPPRYWNGGTLLTEEEKIAGRRFRESCQQHLLERVEAAPATFIVPNILSVYRHNCSSRGGRSSALNLKEHYTLSPLYIVRDGIALLSEEIIDNLIAPTDVEVAEGRFGFIFKEGKCGPCGATAKCRLGRVVDAHARPPVEGRVAR